MSSRFIILVMVDLDVWIFGTLLISDSVCLCKYYIHILNLKLSPYIFCNKYICEGRFLKIRANFIYVSLLILVCVCKGCSFWWKRAMILVNIQRVHHFSREGIQSWWTSLFVFRDWNLVLPCVASSVQSVLGLEFNQTKGFHI